ncbi:7TM diverse intracellular signaling domain-containing protein [Candidatus Sulfurimonas baltica]|uniref:histidine kinase n=1 Tax=Candidatus Sulfurimonas baltica TaxID=2740404 RepID=A0A7S7LTC6_9BACT|nr:7TM diverse intracellular signaling domain-containing protein [Candidatus Sulfurimonas baltica]QOY50962.1 ATP-binding protein [Candidatus Sulfurimonas baltica]
MIKYIFTFLFFITTLFSDSNIIVGANHNINDRFKISYIKDESALLKIEDVTNEEFSKTTTNNFTLGYTKGALWLKFSVTNASLEERFIISLNESFYEVANLYYFDKKWIKKSNGVFVPIQTREVKESKLSFEVPIATGQTQTFYVQLQGKYSCFGKVTVEKKSFLHYNSILSMNTINILLFGILLMIVLFNLFLYLKLKEKIFLYYVGYSFFNLVYIVNMSGLLSYVGLGKYIYHFHLSAAFMIGFLVLFSLEYLKVKKYLKNYYKALRLLSGIFFILGILVLFSYQPWNKVINNLAGLTSIILILISVIIYFKGYSKSKYYILAMMTYFVFVVLFTFMVVGQFEYTFTTRYGFIIASAIEAIIFSLMLADRYNEMKDETIATQKVLIDIKNTTQDQLKKEVRNRTDDLTKTNKQLKLLIDERELLLREVYHRVKNNFHVIIGMLWFENTKVSSDAQKFTELINRIKSMSMIHEHLYNSSDLVNINLKEYLEKIVRNLSASYGDINLQMSDMSNKVIVEFDHAISIGILVNEVLTNAVKHNQENKNLSIKIALYSEENRIFLIIQDNGLEFKKAKNEDGLGLKLIDQFCKKLPNSNYTFSFDNGTKFKLNFEGTHADL